jgi:DNA-binding NarL/FixJ family response regulator
MTNSKASKQKVLIVDDEPIARLGLATLINREPSLSLCGEAIGTAQGLEMAQKLKPNLAILDIAVEGDRGLEFIKTVQDKCKVLVFSLREETLYAERCLLAGAKGYVSKREPIETVRNAIQAVLQGKVFVSERVRERLYNRMLQYPATVSHDDVCTLTDRELEVFELLGQGATTQEAAKRLHVSVKTVQGYHMNIRDRLNLANYNQLIRRAVHYVLEGQ